jgi:GT2 family glycosyltransferase
VTSGSTLTEGDPATDRPSEALDVSVVVVTYNSSHCVQECLASLAEHLRPAEIVVVDNGSDDDSVEAVRRGVVADPVVVEAGTNLGFARACNLGVARARCETVMFVNPDVRISHVDRHALEEALTEPRLGLLVPLLSPTPGTTAEHQIFPYRPWRRAVLAQAWAPLRPRELRRRRRPARSVESAWAAAALLFVRRQELLDAGGFDSRFFLYGEDVDLSRRYRASGLGVHLTDSVAGFHAGSASSTLSDSLRVAPLAWSVLGTLEYVSIWEGERAAAHAASTVLRTLRLQHRLLRTLESIPGLRPRATRKRRQIEEIEAFLVAHARSDPPRGEPPYCPGARAALSSSLGDTTA